MTLTNEERAAVEYVVLCFSTEGHPVCRKHVDVLASLLKRDRELNAENTA